VVAGCGREDGSGYVDGVPAAEHGKYNSLGFPAGDGNGDGVVDG